MSDSDGDGDEPKRDINEVREEVRQKLLESFNAFDTESSGSILSTEVKQVIEMMGIKMEDKEIFKVIADIDPGNSGSISFFQL